MLHTHEAILAVAFVLYFDCNSDTSQHGLWSYVREECVIKVIITVNWLAEEIIYRSGSIIKITK